MTIAEISPWVSTDSKYGCKIIVSPTDAIQAAAAGASTAENHNVCRADAPTTGLRNARATPQRRSASTSLPPSSDCNNREGAMGRPASRSSNR